ncbi:hypothetical protein LTR37_007822 [Vermiconidia calcicola]|uniref:Uncharacterized protein n=1 Tax=Vermiconidia calcicola TaxID=1690605 RepID=A0ACC3NE73_9PEZI|nr:hypothetical protein LTR37_007822 [Vermiconidia calcicola]
MAVGTGRPTCSRCKNAQTECIYEAHEGESRWSAQKRRSQKIEAERDYLRELLDMLSARPEQEAVAILRQMRSGHDGYDELVARFRQTSDGTQSSYYPSAGPPPGAHDQRLPPINTMFDVACEGRTTSMSNGSDGSSASDLAQYSTSNHHNWQASDG